jgi:hypothetical protein
MQGYDDLLVLSLGTGNYVHSYNADQVSKWGVIDWLRNEGEAPLVDMVFNASADMVDYNLNIIFNSQDSSHNYLRIQVCHLHIHMISICFRMSWNFTLGRSIVECFEWRPFQCETEASMTLHVGKPNTRGVLLHKTSLFVIPAKSDFVARSFVN